MDRKEDTFMSKQFWGIYASHIKQYITLKRGFGFKYKTEEVIYTIFDRFTIERGETKVGITKDLADEWNRRKPNESDSYRYHRAVCLNQLSSFICKTGIHSYIPQLPPCKSTFTPHIFSQNEISAIFKACDKLRAQKRVMNSIIIILPALFRLLYGTGLRISEALSLRNKDVHLDENYLVVRDCKNGKEHMIPISDSLSDVCKEYLKNRDLLPFRLSENDYFFVSLDGKVCKRDTVYRWFQKILLKANISRNVHGPRLHDLRHTFSVHSLAMMAESGIDLYCSLPILSSYLGHQSLESTNLYVRLTSEIYPALLKDVDMICLNVFPNIGTYEAN